MAETDQNATDTPERTPTRAHATRVHWALIGIFWILAFGVLTVAQSLFVPIVLAIILSLVFSPVRRGLARFGIPPGVSAFFILLGQLATLGSIALFFSGTIQSGLERAPEILPEAASKLEGFFGAIEPVIDASEELDDITGNGAEAVVIRERGALALLAETTPVLLGQIVLTLALAFFLIASGDMFYEKLVAAMPNLKDKKRALSVARDIEVQLSTYLFTITLINAGLGVAVGLTLWAFGFPNPFLFGLAAFLLNYIPYLGAVFGVGLTFVVGLTTFDTLFEAALPALCYWLLTSIEGQFITPVLVGRRLHLNAVVVFCSVALWAWLWSIVGMFLATPMLITLKAISDDVDALRPLSDFLSERRRPTPRDRILLRRIFRRRDHGDAAAARSDKSSQKTH